MFSPSVLVLLSVATFACAEDWPQYRGPRRDGTWHESGLLKRFPEGGLKICWHQPVSYGWSSPSVAAGRVFVADTIYADETAKERIHCLDEKDGHPLWEFEYVAPYPKWAFSPDQLPGPISTPTVEGNLVYTLGNMGRLICFEAATGKVCWERELAQDFELPEMQCRASPLIEGHLLYVCVGAKPGATIVAFDKVTGQEVWRALSEAVANSSPMIFQVGGKRQLILWTGDSVSSLDPATGAVYWRETMTTSNNDDNAAPVFDGRRLLISGLMFRLSATEPAKTILWPNSRAVAKRLLSNTSTGIIQGEFVYSSNMQGELVCLAAETGQEVWKVKSVTKMGRGAAIHIIPGDDYHWLYTDEGNLVLAEISPNGYREISRAHLIDPVYQLSGRKFAWAMPAFANGHVFVRNETELVCASLKEE